MRVFFLPLPVILAVLFLTSPSAHSQGTPSDPAVVVTATRTSTRINELTSDVTVIDREQLDTGGATLREVMRSVPGMEITQTGSQGNALSMFIRGTNSDHVLVLIDGVPMGSATLGTTAFENIPLEQIERIEILRGPASSLYGSSALGGVIQIFTRSGQGDPGVNFSAGYGSYNTVRLSAGTGHEKDGLRYAFQVGTTNTDGINAIRNPRSTSFNADADGYRNVNLSGQIAKSFGPGQELGFKMLYSDGLSHFDSTPSINDFRTYSTLSSTSLYGRTRIGEKWGTRLSFGTSTDDSTSYTSATVQAVFRTVQNQIAWQNDISLPVGTLIVALETLRQRIHSTTNFPVTGRDVNTLAVAYQASVGRHHLQLSGRKDWYDQFGNRNTGYAGYGFDISPAFRVTAGAGTAFKAPSFNQLYFPGFGNPNLLPESARNNEVGLQYNGQLLRIGVVHFRNRVTNLIVNAGTPLRPQNIGQAKISGTTVTASAQAFDTEFSAALNHQDPRDATNNRLLARRAEEFMNLNAVHPAFGGRLGLEVFATGPRFNDTANLQRMGGYTLLNAYFDRRINPQWTTFVRVDNLDNKVYESVRDFNVPGRSLFAGVRYQEK